uniref:Glycosyltransferase RgtA/B/C/D-like domain-containing protein n=1 Tax=Solibacter usitatus (strain Ellin6076) TaxID=234267 RepID=Q01Y92_SOLUE
MCGALRKLAARSRRAAERTTAGPRWKARVVLVVLAFSLLRAFPNYNFLREAENQGTWRDAAIKMQDPAVDMARRFPPASHEAKLTFRITVPLLARALHLGRSGMLALFALCGVFTLYLTLDLSYRIAHSRVAAAAICLGVACVWPGVLAFHQLLGGFYDAVALCLVLAAMRAPAPLAAAALFFGAWTDERALLAAGLILVYAALRREFARTLAIAAAGITYVATRLYYTNVYSLHTSWDGVGLGVLLKNFNMAPLGVWTGLGGCWLIVAAGLWVLLARRRFALAMAYGLALTAVIAVALVVEDVTRSMAYALPAVFVALGALAESEPPVAIERLAAAGALVCALLPTYFTQSGNATWLLPSVFQAIRLALYPRLG